MPNLIDANGLQVKTQAEMITEISTKLKAAYGTDINLDQDTPDGQNMMIFVQATVDVLEILKQIYTGFDPDQAFGKVLDSRIAINGIKRQAGTYTTTNITIVTDRALNIYGLDQSLNDIFTISDNAGNQWNLLTSQTIAAAGTYVFLFRSSLPGARLTIPNTITQPVTIVLGVSSINNPTTYATLGLNEETDSKVKIRRQKSTAISSQGYLAGLQAALENINGVVSAKIYENKGAATDANGVPGHSIWVIIAGAPLSSDVAAAIYLKRNAGCGMRGAESYFITQVDGSVFEINWDFVVAENLFIKFDATSIDGINAPNTALILSQLPVDFVPGVDERININDLATAVQNIDPNTLVTNAGFSYSGGGPFTAVLEPSSKNKQFAVSSGNISITVV